MNTMSNLLLVGQDVRVTGIQDGHGRAAEELSAGSAELNLFRDGLLADYLPSKVYRRLFRWVHAAKAFEARKTWRLGAVA